MALNRRALYAFVNAVESENRFSDFHILTDSTSGKISGTLSVLDTVLLISKRSLRLLDLSLFLGSWSLAFNAFLLFLDWSGNDGSLLGVGGWNDLGVSWETELFDEVLDSGVGEEVV